MLPSVILMLQRYIDIPARRSSAPIRVGLYGRSDHIKNGPALTPICQRLLLPPTRHIAATKINPTSLAIVCNARHIAFDSRLGMIFKSETFAITTINDKRVPRNVPVLSTLQCVYSVC